MVGPAPPASSGRGPVLRYAVGVVVVSLAILSPYFVPEVWPASRLVYGTFAGGLVIVYGLPIVALSLLVGAGPLRGWRANPGRATILGVGWYGAMSLLALVVTFVLAAVYAIVNPGALKLLERPNPALQAAAGDPWFFVGFSFVVGALEETIFRGWIFGFWVGRSASWLTPAILSSLLFAGLHLYYGTTYGIASPLIFPTLFLLGFAFAATYRYSGGNLLAPAVLHGANDATAYLTLIALGFATALHWLLVLGGALAGLVWFLNRATTTPTGPAAWPPPPSWASAESRQGHLRPPVP